MHRFRSVLAVMALLVWAGLSTPAMARTSADAQFKAIYETEWAWRDAQLIADSWDGPIRERMPQIDEKTQAARLAYWDATLAKLSKVRVEQLSAKARADYGVYRLQITTLANSQRFKDYEAPFNSDSAFWSEMASTARKPFKTVQDYRKFIAQMQTWPSYFEQSEANMRAGLARGFTPPKVTLMGREASVAVILRPIWPDLPMPVTMTRPGAAPIRATASANRSPRPLRIRGRLNGGDAGAFEAKGAERRGFGLRGDGG